MGVRLFIAASYCFMFPIEGFQYENEIRDASSVGLRVRPPYLIIIYITIIAHCRTNKHVMVTPSNSQPPQFAMLVPIDYPKMNYL